MLPQMVYNGEEEVIAANEDLSLIENVDENKRERDEKFNGEMKSIIVEPEVKIESGLEEVADVNNGVYNDNAVTMEPETIYASSVNNRLPDFVCGPVLHADSKYT